MIIKEAHAMNRTLPFLRFLAVVCGLLKWPLKDVNFRIPFKVYRKAGF